MINILFTPTIFHTVNGFDWECQHESASLDYATINNDDTELVTVCDSCPAQLIGEEWISE